MTNLHNTNHNLTTTKEELPMNDINIELLEALVAEDEVTGMELTFDVPEEEKIPTEETVQELKKVNESALVSSMGVELFRVGLEPITALVTAVSYIGAVGKESMEDFMEAFLDGINSADVDIKDQDVTYKVEGEEIIQALVKTRLFKEVDGVMELGPRLVELMESRQEAYMPMEYGTPWVRKFNYCKIPSEGLIKEAIHALEDTQFTICEDTYDLAVRVDATRGEGDNVLAYVMEGCSKMSRAISYFSEYKADKGGRLYQTCFKGPNSMASDRERALYNFSNVPTDYNIESAKALLQAEILDMVSCSNKEIIGLMKEFLKDDVAFMNKYEKRKVHTWVNGKKVSVETNSDTKVPKAWSFGKATKIWSELMKGNRPYIGMGFGLDAKCSGPQLGAILVGDEDIAKACGLSLKKVEDAYQRAIRDLQRAGFNGITRAGIKKAYMAIFYGQGWMAYTDTRRDSLNKELMLSLYGESGIIDDDTAKRFHKVLSKSFGTRMSGVRKMFKSYSKKTSGSVKFRMPDGFQVSRDYKEGVNVLGEKMEWDTEAHDISIRNNTSTFKFIKMTMKTGVPSSEDYARNGFVNLIHSMDALVCRMIVVKLKRMGAQHINSIHDCFRVNVHDMELLEAAIVDTYKELFGTLTNEVSVDLPLGTDFLALYFKGVNKQLLSGHKPSTASQFFESGKRRFKKIDGENLNTIFESLGTSYYFAK